MWQDITPRQHRRQSRVPGETIPATRRGEIGTPTGRQKTLT